jgi:hypothetical protein
MPSAIKNTIDEELKIIDGKVVWDDELIFV